MFSYMGFFEPFFGHVLKKRIANHSASRHPLEPMILQHNNIKLVLTITILLYSAAATQAFRLRSIPTTSLLQRSSLNRLPPHQPFTSSKSLRKLSSNEPNPDLDQRNTPFFPNSAKSTYNGVESKWIYSYADLKPETDKVSERNERALRRAATN